MKYIAYYRVSTKKQKRSGLGLESQKAIIEHYTQPTEHEPNKKLIAEFLETDSGGNNDRPQLKKAIKKANKEKAILIVAKTDRLSRDTEFGLQVLRQLDGRLMCCDMPSGKIDKFMFTIILAVADRERELVKIRTKAALKAKKQRGETMGTIANLTAKGREKGAVTKRNEAIKKAENKRATELIHLYKNQGLTLEQIAKKLNDNGFTASKGGKFHKTTVSRLYKRFVENSNN